MTHSYKEQFVEEDRALLPHRRTTDELEDTSDYHIQTGTQKAQLGIVGNLSYQFTPSQRITFENFYTHSGRDEGRTFQGINLDNAREYRNYRLQFIEEGLMANAIGGEHFFQNLSNSRIDWRVNSARAHARRAGPARDALRAAARAAARRDDARSPTPTSRRAASACSTSSTTTRWTRRCNWSVFNAAGGRPTQYKFGVNYVERTRDFQSRRFHFIPITTQKADAGNLLFDNRAAARSSCSRRATSARRSGSTRKRGRPTPTTASRRRRPATAWSTSR